MNTWCLQKTDGVAAAIVGGLCVLVLMSARVDSSPAGALFAMLIVASATCVFSGMYFICFVCRCGSIDGTVGCTGLAVFLVPSLRLNRPTLVRLFRDTVVIFALAWASFWLLCLAAAQQSREATTAWKVRWRFECDSAKISQAVRCPPVICRVLNRCYVWH